MVRRCKYHSCTHSASHNPGCRLHLMPADHFKCRMWLRLCKFAGTPRQMPAAIQICSCHFVGGRGPTKDHPYPIAYDPPASLDNPFSLKTFKKNVRTPKSSPSAIASAHNIPSNTAEVDGPGTPTVLQTVSPPKEIETVSLNATTPLLSFSEVNMSSKEGVETPILSKKNPQIMDSFEEAFKTLPELPSEGNATNTSRSLLPDDINNLTFQIHRRKHGRQDKHETAKEVPAAKKTRAIGIQTDLAEDKDLDFQEAPVEKETGEIGIQAYLPLFSYERCQTWEDKDFQYFTGISKQSFQVLFDMCKEDDVDNLKYRRYRGTPKRTNTSQNSSENKLFLTLVRLRRGFSLTDMRMLFGVTESVVSDIFTTWIRLLSIKFKSMEEAIFVTAQAQEENKPDCYEPFPNLRCVVDTTDVKVQKPKNMEQQSNTFSTYKAANVIKFLVATSLYGGLSFVSEGVEGNMSDRQLFLKSGILHHLQLGDAVMCDRGFDIEADLDEIGVDLLVPPFLGGRESFTAREVLLGKAIASSRIHVETFIGRVKYFKFIRHAVPNTMLDVVSDIFRVCANLVNFNDPFILWDSVKQKTRNKEKRGL